jgi:hypothetical protein
MEGWSFLTKHGRVLLCIAHEPGVRLRDIAASVSGSRTRPPSLTWPSTRPLVFIDEAAKDGPALDLLLDEVSGRVVGPGRPEATAAVGAPSL